MDHQALAQLLGNYWELFGAIAVVATLFYLARQIRQNSRQMEIQAGMQFAASVEGTDLSFSRWREFLITSDEVAAIWNKAGEDFDALAGTERTRADQLLFEFFVLYHNFYLRFRQVGTHEIGVDVVDSIRVLIAHDLESSSIQRWWQQNNHRFPTPDYVDLMSALVQEREDQR